MFTVFITSLSPDASIWGQLRTDTQSVFPGRPGDVVPEVVGVIDTDFVVVRKFMIHRRRQVRLDFFSCNVKGHPQLHASLSLQRFGRTDIGLHTVIQVNILLIRPECSCPHVWLRPCILIQTEGSARFELPPKPFWL